MSDGGDAGIYNGFDAGSHCNATFQLYGIAAGFCHKPAGVLYGQFIAGLVGHVGHIANHKGGRCASSNGAWLFDVLCCIKV